MSLQSRIDSLKTAITRWRRAFRKRITVRSRIPMR